MNPLVTHSAVELARLIRTRAVSPVEVVDAYLNRIGELNERFNSIATLAPDARRQAQQAEAAVMRGDKLRALHGVPITIKDTIETAGLLTTSGSRLRAQFVPKRDAPAVLRLKAAGAVVLGKTNVAEMAMDYTADNPVFGRTNNPYDLSRTPGGSSGGEAAAIATCMSPAGLGTDLAGSIRIPAHFCGIAGLKPTTGVVPGGGQFPPSIGPYSLGAVIGPLARTVDDLKLLFGALTQDEGTVTSEELRGQRVAWYSDDQVSPVTSTTRSAVAAAAQALSEAGLITEEMLPPGIEHGYDLWLKLFSRASVVQLRDVYQGHEEVGGSFVRWRLSTADDSPPPTLDEYIGNWMERDRLRERLLDWMQEVPFLLSPVGATNALEHNALKVEVDGVKISAFRAFSYSQAFNVFDLPVVCVRAGQSDDGLPIGVQIVGRPHTERMVLAAAKIIEQSLGPWAMPVLA